MKLYAVVVVSLAGLATVADAKPLPAGLAIVLKKDTLVATKGGLSVPLFDGDDEHVGRNFQSVKPATLSDDGKQLEVFAAGCVDMDDTAIEVPLAAIDARFENLTGMQFHLQKKYPDAISHFTAAVLLDPATPLYQTNLLSAQSMGNKLDDADKTLATYGPKNLAWFAWRLAVDSDLKNLVGRASAKALNAPKPTTIAFPKTEGVAVSPLGLVAVTEWIVQGMGPGATTANLAIYDLKQDKKLLVLPLASAADDCVVTRPKDVPPEMMPVCTKAQNAHIAANAHVANLVLGALGFELRKSTWTQFGDAPNPDLLVSPDKAITVAFNKDGTATVARGKATATTHVPIGGQTVRVAWAPGVVVLQNRTSYQCGGADSVQSYSDVLAAP